MPVLDVVHVLEAHHHLFERCIAGAFAESVHGGIDVAGTAAHGRQGVGGGQPQVVVGVHLEFAVADRGEVTDALKGTEGVQ